MAFLFFFFQSQGILSLLNKVIIGFKKCKIDDKTNVIYKQTSIKYAKLYAKFTMDYFYLFSLYSMRVLVTFDSTKYEFLLQFLKPHLI